jgi:PPOX class probable F420-dependent enzyme
MASVLPDPSTPFGERVARRLRDERVIWLTTVGGDGRPQPNPVWFHWDGTSFLVYSLADARRLANLRRNPKVALHFDGDGQGGDIVVFAGDARVSADDPPADRVPEFVERYRERMTRVFGDPAGFAARYPVALRITPTRVRGH